MVKIYVLTEPDTNEIRYIGKTITSLRERLAGHMAETHPCHKTNWIRSLGGRRPGIYVLEECADSEWQFKERFWIARYRLVGARLTNTGNGGDGLGKHSDETKQKLSAAHKGISRPCTPLRALMISLGKKGKPLLKLRGRKWSDEWKRKQSERMRGRPRPGARGKKQSPELIAKRVASRLANKLCKTGSPS